MREYHPRYYCTRRARAVLRRPVLFSLAPPPPPSPPRSRVDSFISPRISVCPLAFPRSLLIPLSLRHSHFVLIAIGASIISSSPSHISSRRTIRPRLSVQSRFFPLRSFPSHSSLLSPFRASLSPLFLPTFLLISDPPFSPFTLLPPRDSVSLSLFLFFFFSVAHLASFVRPRVFPRPFVTRSAARHDRRVTITRGPGPILRSVRPAGLRTCVSIYGKFRARPFFRSPHEFSPSRHICFPFFFPLGISLSPPPSVFAPSSFSAPFPSQSVHILLNEYYSMISEEIRSRRFLD